MSLGERSRVYCPPSMGYGYKGIKGLVPGNQHLIFDIELISYM